MVKHEVDCFRFSEQDIPVAKEGITVDSALAVGLEPLAFIPATTTSTAHYTDHDYHIMKNLFDRPAPSIQRFGVERFQNNNDAFNSFTGFKSYDLFRMVYNAIEPHAINMIRYSQMQRFVEGRCKTTSDSCDSNDVSLCLIDQFFLFLNKVRVGNFDFDLADKFNISVSTVSRIVITWANFLYTILGKDRIWPSRAKIQKCMPSDFRKHFPNTRVILDCTEIYTQNPSSLVLKSKLYSNYKSRSTFKSLVGITPWGAICFVSDLYSGCASDKFITSDSGILRLLEPSDAVMVDKGFLIQDLLEPLGCSLIIPPFLSANAQFNTQEVQTMNEIARLRVHVERAIQRVKEYHLFDKVIPLNLMGSINQIWTVCCILTNFRGPLF
jgi:hypothetical protein